MIYFPSYRTFCKFIQDFRSDKPALPKYKMIPLYILGLLIVGWFWFILLTMLALCSGGGRKYPSNKYRKVVKEGLFFDSVEYHER